MPAESHFHCMKLQRSFTSAYCSDKIPKKHHNTVCQITSARLVRWVFMRRKKKQLLRYSFVVWRSYRSFVMHFRKSGNLSFAFSSQLQAGLSLKLIFFFLPVYQSASTTCMQIPIYGDNCREVTADKLSLKQSVYRLLQLLDGPFFMHTRNLLRCKRSVLLWQQTKPEHLSYQSLVLCV